MKILRNDNNNKILLQKEQSFRTDAGWEGDMQELETQTLKKIINVIENYETVRYIHNPYTGSTLPTGLRQTDIWFQFYFLSGATYVQDYDPTGLSSKENVEMLAQFKNSFFRLEFFKTPNNAAPDRTNRRLVFAKNLSLPLGEKYFYEELGNLIFKPVFMGSNYRNSENMYLFWFQDDTALNETTLTGNTFWMSAKFYNAEDGSILDFVKTDIGSAQVNESNDMYYKMVIDRTNYSYELYRYNNGTQGSRIGESNDPIKFYQKKG
jgi:hypothetical protein